MENYQLIRKYEIILSSIRAYKPRFLRNCYSINFKIFMKFREHLSIYDIAFLKSLGFRWNKARGVWLNQTLCQNFN